MLAAQKAEAQTYQQSVAASPSGSNGGSWNLPASTYTIPQLSQQQQDYLYTTELNMSIFGTPWDPYD